MRNYDGTLVDYDQVKSQYLSKIKLKNAVVKSIESSGTAYSLSEAEQLQLEKLLQAALLTTKQPFITIGKDLISRLFFVLIFVAPTVIFMLLGLKNVAIILACLTFAFIVVLYVQDRVFNRVIKEKFGAFQNNDYQAYQINEIKKLWCFTNVTEGAEEQDHATIDDEGNLYDFFIDCGILTFPVTEHEYLEVSNRIIMVLFRLNGRVAFEYLI